ncbi:short-chain dehydrogenase/reductase [Nostoc cf. commune SO-36]|uniref:Short-chain dehydrogenase/reductase n=1 Tax=Nostoc cf. commune SO-36 TaxID=449208 RepID=A0ABN6QCY0_NOSCO|nr:oxidoreductase [Nostoc commune]BDI20294.1 short-chain dehydrogenase/reductase [Nostoc cf. commune SO-36]
MSKVYLITGTSTGFGRSLASAVLERGDKVVLTARKPEQVAELVQANQENAIAIRLDVTNAEERRAAVKAAVERFGRIDVLVNNAGIGSLGALEGFSSEQIRKQFEVNCFGVIEMTREVLPVMREQKSGHILNITSIGGLVSIGGFALYCATKFAVEGFAEGLRDEVKPLGINVTIVEPGAFRTNFAGDANMQPETEIDDYKGVIEPLREYLYGGNGKQPGDPKKAALAIIQVVESENPPLRLMLGLDAYSLWEQRRTVEREEFQHWREIGINTAFEGADVTPIGG